MNKIMSNRIKRLEKESGGDNGLAEYLKCIGGLAMGPPSQRPPISKEKQEQIDFAWSKVSEEVKAELVGED